MSAPRSRTTFGEGPVDRLITELIAHVGDDENDDLVRSLIVTALDMDQAELDRLEMKIANQALVEMLNASSVFSPYSELAKVTIFGSARTQKGTPDYELAVAFGELMGRRNWMAITGAGPGIMTAGMEGIGREKSFGVNIELPFEQSAAEIIDGDSKLATFKYFFTRKLTFMKESDAFVLLPGGFGTLDEGFELLTLIQTGKTYPAPVVLLDHPGSNYWKRFIDFVSDELLANQMISKADLGMFVHTHDPVEAANHICGFYSCYHSLRYVGKQLVIRMRHKLSAEQISLLSSEFADILESGSIESIDTTEAELSDDEFVDLPRIALNFNQSSFGRLTSLIQKINDLAGQGNRPTSNFLHDVEPTPLRN